MCEIEGGFLVGEKMELQNTLKWNFALETNGDIGFDPVGQVTTSAWFAGHAWVGTRLSSSCFKQAYHTLTSC